MPKRPEMVKGDSHGRLKRKFIQGFEVCRRSPAVCKVRNDKLRSEKAARRARRKTQPLGPAAGGPPRITTPPGDPIAQAKYKFLPRRTTSLPPPGTRRLLRAGAAAPLPNRPCRRWAGRIPEAGLPQRPKPIPAAGQSNRYAGRTPAYATPDG